MTRHALIALALLGTTAAPVAQAQLPAASAGSDRALPAEARAKALVDAMTTEEKLAIIAFMEDLINSKNKAGQSKKR